MSVPQTVAFDAIIRFDQIERDTDQPREIQLTFNTLERMLTRFRQERKRRAIADRATSGKYRLFLTAYGERACDADAACRERHADVGTWHTL